MSHAIDIEYLLRHNWWGRVAVGAPDECWMWERSTGSHGYGQTWDGITVRLAHRVAWVLAHGTQIPIDLTIDHLCRVRLCCNPAHLQLLTNELNGQLNGHAVKTHCPRGHPYNDTNTYRDGKGHRRCRACTATRKRF